MVHSSCLQSEDYALSLSKISKLKRESKNNDAVFKQLCIESLVRDWLKSHKIPSWRNPRTPNSEDLVGLSSRYSILLSDGSRFLVKSSFDTYLSLEMLAVAKCFGVVFVEPSQSSTSGKVRGAVFLKDLVNFQSKHLIEMEGVESPSVLLHYLHVPKSYFFSTLLTSLRILFLGEPDAPQKAAHEVVLHNRSNSELQEAGNDRS